MDREAQVRLAAVEHLDRIAVGGTLSSTDLRAGFRFEG
jgi:hypothetical protein